MLRGWGLIPSEALSHDARGPGDTRLTATQTVFFRKHPKNSHLGEKYHTEPSNPADKYYKRLLFQFNANSEEKITLIYFSVNIITSFLGVLMGENDGFSEIRRVEL